VAPLRGFARFATVAVLALSLAGCAIHPPEWGFFDSDRHPVGGTAACSGYYVGAFVVYPLTIAAIAIVGLFVRPDLSLEATSSGVDGHRAGASLFGTGLGLAVGAPFHYFALPFQGYEEEPPPEDWGRKVDDRPMP
jgi:hypothetical protein